MILAGTTLGGVTVSGIANLQTLGGMVTWYDYRFGLTVSGGLASAITDLTGNGFTQVQTNSIFRPTLVPAEGLYSGSFKSSPTSALNFAHNGGAFFCFSVHSPVSNPAWYRTAVGGGSAGFEMRTNHSLNRMILQMWNDAGTSIVNVNSGSSTVFASSTVKLIAVLYYGGSFGSNNVKFIQGVDTFIKTATGTFGTGDPEQHRIEASTDSTARTKCWGLYNLTGKTGAEIDTFLTNFITVLKQDSEYSSLPTP